MNTVSAPEYTMKEPKGLSERVQWLRDYYFRGTQRAWNNEYTSWTTGTPWDIIYNELTFYIVPETYTLLTTLALPIFRRQDPLRRIRFLAVAAGAAAGLVCEGSYSQSCTAGNTPRRSSGRRQI